MDKLLPCLESDKPRLVHNDSLFKIFIKGCFLSNGSASGTVLHKLLIECISLAENAGLLIDVVTWDAVT